MENHTGNRYKNLAAFDAAHAPAGLLERYVVGRSRTIWLRLGLAVLGCLFLGVVVSPQFALLIASITLSLEILEHWVLRRWIARKAFDSLWAKRTIWMASLMQAVGIGVSVFLTGIISPDLRLVAWAFLLGATLNSMLAASYHPASHRVRMGVLCLFAAAVLVKAIWTGQIGATMFGIEAIALMSMGMMLWHLFSHLSLRETRMRMVERALIARSEDAERLAMVAEYASDSIMLMDPSLKIVWVNPQFTKVTGYSAKFAIGKAPNDFLSHPDTAPEAIAALINAAQRKEPINLRLLNKKRDGSTVWIETHQTPMLGEDGEIKAFIAVERDVTDLVAREQQLRLALVAAEDADREKAAFLSRMSHELRTPANGIFGGVEILRETETCDVQQEALDILASSANRLMALVENVVTMAGAQSGTIKTQLEDVRMADVITAVISQHRETALKRGIKLRAEMEPSARSMVRTDFAIVYGALDKLVNNAVKFTSEGHVLVKARKDADGWLHISVEDTGVGIESDKVSEIFEVFEQADEAETRSFDGAGLGLAVAKDLASLLGGRIRVSSVVGEGSKFKLKIPLGAGDATPHSAQVGVACHTVPAQGDHNACGSNGSETPEYAHAQKRQMRLLVAEDNRTNRMLIKSMLKTAGHAIEFAHDGEQAVAQYMENRPDFVLMDLSMPNKNGLEATRDIRAFEAKDSLRRCPIVAVTANVTDHDRQRCIEAGMDAFLPKPVKKDLLIETIGDISQHTRTAH